ncbi:dihydrofolate reductase [Lingula anatina]|uniref:dihydrofolate reductase n=1 Tax=Lingula anatina TaxID=7574 RepID=A0A1S3J0F9_LINAN|nr:dihydrofolate reductase [Lingula anatina]XP_013403930.1 dihydrofolate reductase [Lingula anatina]|eukprot:XP_013403929.1 dihydrofolate reductase [Lingula anatina]
MQGRHHVGHGIQCGYSASTSSHGIMERMNNVQVYDPAKLQPPTGKFNAIVALSDRDGGIGNKGTLPWPKLSKDLEYYQTLTSFTTDPSKKCVNIRGRLTWEAGTAAVKSHPRRLNVVISSKMAKRPEHVHHIAKSFEEALSWSLAAEDAENVWVLGGSNVYKTAMSSPLCHRVYVTRVFGEFESDVFFPEIDPEKFQHVRDEALVDTPFEENGTRYQFEIYERKPVVQ